VLSFSCASPLRGQLKLTQFIPDELVAWVPARGVYLPANKYKKAPVFRLGLSLYWEPGGELLSHGECHTTIVAAAFHF
jgi:hypothetical protein